MKNLISIQDLDKNELLQILKLSEKMKKDPIKSLLKGEIMGSCFYESSTRTRLSFETAMLKLGGKVIGFSNSSETSTTKGESLHDTMKMMESYADVIVLRHPSDGAARFAAQIVKKPVINAGDGTNQHPTQTLLDLFTIQQCQGKLKGLHVVFVGDLKNGRTVHSLSLACALFDMRLYFVSSESLRLPEEICHELQKRTVRFSFHQNIEEVIGKADILYMTRLQKERFSDQSTAPKNHLILQKSMLSEAKKNLKILHPLPRVDEIAKEVDQTPFAHYFNQAENAIVVRQAILMYCLGT
ncbi:MAG TPA: aspartate carbamoyltransferase [Rhabdochlamydiaceae bacterium]|nr:aspartate carbamoyltransferase [Rhabdochlamydiaceae bacterium]